MSSLYTWELNALYCIAGMNRTRMAAAYKMAVRTLPADLFNQRLLLVMTKKAPFLEYVCLSFLWLKKGGRKENWKPQSHNQETRKEKPVLFVDNRLMPYW